METMTDDQMPPLRWATRYLVKPDGPAVEIGALAMLAEVDLSRAKAYVSILTANMILVDTEEGVIAGSGWAPWFGHTPRVRHELAGETVRAVSAMRMNIRKGVTDALRSRGWSNRVLSRRAGVSVGYVAKLLARGQVPPVCEMALIAKALGTTVDHLIGSGDTKSAIQV